MRRGRFLEKSARPPSSENPLKYESAFYFSTANYAIYLDSCGDIHCALYTSAIDKCKCAMVFVPPLAIENRRS
jgi:hypothetical protein